MQLLSDEEAYAWAGRAGVDPALLPPHGGGPPAGAPVGGRVRLRLPAAATEVIGIAYMLVAAAVPEHEEERFPGALVWLRAWEIWSESIDGAGYVLLDGLRAPAGDGRPIGAAPAHLFGPGEFGAAHACLALPMLFQWDAHYLAPGGALTALVSHEGYVDLACRDAEERARLAERFRPWLAPEG